MKLQHLRLLIISLCLALGIGGCGKKEGGSSGEAGTKKKKLAFVVNNAATFWTIARAGTADAAKELGNVEVEFKIPSDGTAAQQRQILDDLLAKGVDGIAVSPIDPGNQTELDRKSVV